MKTGENQERTLRNRFNTLVLTDVFVKVKSFMFDFLEYIFINETLVSKKHCTSSD